MDLGAIKEIAEAGMSLQRLKVEMAGLNIANANTVLQSGGSALKIYNVNTHYQSKSIFHSLLENNVMEQLPEVTVDSNNAPVESYYEPQHPMADAMGMVHKAGIDTTQEMLNVIAATRAYEANIRVYNSASAMSQKALEIGANR